MRHHKALKRLMLGIAALIVAGACVQDTPAIFIVQNSALDNGCEPTKTATGDVLGAGRMDLTVATTYRMHLLVENLMSNSGTASLGGGTITADYEGNRVTFTNAFVSIQGPPSGLGVALPEEQAIPISGTLEPANTAVVSMDVIGNALGLQLAAAIETRGMVVPLTVSVRFEGTTTSGTSVESNQFMFPLEVCRGCLLEFPLAATDSTFTPPNCLNTSEDQTVESSCLPGQDDPLDCRDCRAILQARGESPSTIATQCEPGQN